MRQWRNRGWIGGDFESENAFNCAPAARDTGRGNVRRPEVWPWCQVRQASAGNETRYGVGMTVRPIALIGEPVLRADARLVQRGELDAMQPLIDDLIETMRHANGAGLAATQIFESVQICAIEVKDNPRYPYKPNIPLTVLINPVLTQLGEETFENYEGCLSVPNLRGLVRRHVGVRVQAWDRHGDLIDREVWGLSAGTYQHEVDHLFGKLFVDRVEDTTTLCTWEVFARDHFDAFSGRASELARRFRS